MSKAALVTVHGMGENKGDYARGLIDGVKSRLDANEAAALSIEVVDYKKILQGNEQAVWDACKLDGWRNLPGLRKFILFGFGDAAGLETRKDEPRSAYEDAQFEIATTLLAARAAMGGNFPIVVIAQSLGGQVFSSFIWDAQRARHAQRDPAARPPAAGIWRPGAWMERLEREPTEDEMAFLRGETMTCLLTTGCNIPVFIGAHKVTLIKPIDRPRPDFEWHNFYDPQDVLGWPLAPLRCGYETLVTDHRINAGGPLTSWNPMSHTAYWEDRDVLQPLVEQIRRALRGHAPSAEPEAGVGPAAASPM